MANNPYVNKVEYNNNVLIDLTGDTISSSDLRSGVTAHDSSGASITGNLVVPTNQASKSYSALANGTFTITPDTNYDGMEEVALTVNVPSATLQSKTLTLGSATPSTVTPDSGYDGLSSVSVDLDSTVIKAENIAEGVTILGIVGTHSGGGLYCSIWLTGTVASTDTVTCTMGALSKNAVWTTRENVDGWLIDHIVDLGTWTVTVTNSSGVWTADILFEHSGEQEATVSFTNKTFVAVYGATSYYTNDASTWYPMTGLTSTGGNCVGYGNNRFISAGTYSFYSTNGTSWVAMSNKPYVACHGVTYGNGVYATVDGYGYSDYSTDGITWAGKAELKKTILFSFIVYGNGRFVAIGNSGYSAYSTNGTSWSAGVMLPSTSSYNCMAYGNNAFFAIQDRTVITSSDGESWVSTGSTIGGFSSMYGLAYGNGIFVAVGADGTVAKSTNGYSWTVTNYALGSNNNGRAIAYGNGYFVATCRNGTSFVSADGTTWVAMSGISTDTKSIAYGEMAQ